MQDKHKVTLYLPPELHKQLKIKAAVESEPMSTIAERALVFYLTHSEIVDEVEQSHGQVHRVYDCPGCESSYILRDGELVAMTSQPGVLEELPVSKVNSVPAEIKPQDEEKLVPC